MQGLFFFLAFPLKHGDGHTCRVDVTASQAGHLGTWHAGRVDGHQQGMAFEVHRCGEYPCYFLLAEDQSKSLLVAWKGSVLLLTDRSPAIAHEIRGLRSKPGYAGSVPAKNLA